MKKIISTAFVLIVLVTVTRAQTTWEEYRYVTAGLKDDLQKGKDIKQGYALNLLGDKASVSQAGIMRNAQLYYFKKGSQAKALVIQCSDSQGNVSYFCIPTANAPADIWEEAFKAIKSGGQEWQLVFFLGLGQSFKSKNTITLNPYKMKQLITVFALIGMLAVTGCASTSDIKKYAESASSFNGPTQLIENNYPMDDIYRVYKKGGSAFSSTEQLKTYLEKKIVEFAKKKGRSFVILGQRVTTGTIGRFSRVEIIFALTDKK